MFKRYKMNKLKVGYFVISSRCLEFTIQRFEEVGREISVSSVVSQRQLEITV